MIKKNFTLISISLIICIVFASCGTRYTIKKRHYSSGYYISNGSNNGEAPTNTKIKKENSKNETSTDNVVVLKTKVNDDKSVLGVKEIAIAKSTTKTESKVDPIVNSNQKMNQQSNERNNTANVNHHSKAKIGTKNLNPMKDSGDGLSLFWIIILIILILWAIGYIGGSVGAIINLLLVVALILLILWLLRII